MKRFTKRLAALLMTAVMAAGIVPSAAMAAPDVPKSVIVYTGSTTFSSYGEYVDFSVGGKVTKSSVKSDKKWLVKHNVYSNESKDITEFFDGTKDSKQTYEGGSIGFFAKQEGTANVSFKIGKKSYKTKVTVKKYKNPVKSIKSAAFYNGKDFASKTKKIATSAVKGVKTKKNQFITIKANSGWVIDYVSFNDDFSTMDATTKYYDSKSSVKYYMGDIKKGKSYSVFVIFRNKNDNGTINVMYDFK